MEATELMKGAIDIHIHVGPDPIRRRRVTAYEAAIQARDAGMRGIVLKSHHYVTTPITTLIRQFVPEIELFGGLALDEDVGGLNPIAVKMAGRIGTKIVWMPTFSSRCDLERRGIKGKGISLLDDNGKLLPTITEILKFIKQYDMTLATGHISTPEIFALLKEVKVVGVQRTIITHPLSTNVGCNATIEEQKRMVEEGAFIEHCFVATMPATGRLDPAKMAEAIKTVGAENCIMSTDFGQIVNPPPAEGMRMFIETMIRYGLSEDEIIKMIRYNPAKVLGLPV